MTILNKILICVLLTILVIGCQTKTDFSDRIPAVKK